MLATVGCVAEWCKGWRFGGDALISGVCIDSRRLRHGDLFVALPGARVDGHAFVSSAQKKGASAVMVMAQQSTSSASSVALAQIVVQDCTAALTTLASGWRRLFAGKVTAITGSNGKTTVKEMLSAICRAAVGEARAHHSAGNMNNALGASLSLLALRPQHDFAVLETGMDAAGELSQLSALCRPHVALINNAQRAHLGNFASVADIARAKSEVLDGLADDGVAVLNADDVHFPLWQKRAGRRRVLSFGFDADADFVGRLDDEGLHLPYCVRPLQLAIAGVHNARNALAAAAAAHALELSPEAVVQGLESFVGVRGRLQHRRGVGGVLILDDSYNANPDSLAAALAVLSSCAGMKIAVLGDMLALGAASDASHRQAVEAAHNMGAMLVTVGEHFAAVRQHSSIADEAFRHFDDKKELVAFLQDFLQQKRAGRAECAVLVKGSRGMQMEEVSGQLCAADSSVASAASVVSDSSPASISPASSATDSQGHATDSQGRASHSADFVDDANGGRR